jgi:hypothetical protein
MLCFICNAKMDNFADDTVGRHDGGEPVGRDVTARAFSTTSRGLCGRRSYGSRRASTVCVHDTGYVVVL